MARATPERLDDDRLQIRVGTDGVIRHWGTGLKGVYGYTPDEAIGRSVEFLIPSVLREWHWKGFNRALASGHLKHPGRRARVPAMHKNGSIVEVRAWPSLTLGTDGKVEGVVSGGAMRGPALAGPIWKAVLAVIDAGQRLRAWTARRRSPRPAG
jgi:PAS domain S-box-containing protein